jgi:hypothetical protein
MDVPGFHIAEELDLTNYNKESWLRGIHPQPLCPYAKTKIKFVLIIEKCRLSSEKRKAYII